MITKKYTTYKWNNFVKPSPWVEAYLCGLTHQLMDWFYKIVFICIVVYFWVIIWLTTNINHFPFIQDFTIPGLIPFYFLLLSLIIKLK